MPRPRSANRKAGRQIARVLSGAWRVELPASPPALDDLKAVRSQLLATGAGPLTWRRVREAPFAGERSLVELRNAHRLSALNVGVHASEIARVVGGLRSRGLRPLLVKGWAIARHYPDPALRPYGDLDLLLPPDEWEEAARMLETLASPHHSLEIHLAGEGTYRVLPPSEWSTALERCESIELHGIEIEVPAPEDHFRILSAHLLAHGAWRPLWLCDLAVALESGAGDWNWDYLLRGPAAMAGWLEVCLRLPGELLGAELPEMPQELLQRPLPAWIGNTVLEQWGAGTGGSRREVLSLAFLKHVAARGRLRDELLGHWPNPLQAAFERHAPVTPRVPRGTQLAAAAARIPRFFRTLFAPDP